MNPLSLLALLLAFSTGVAVAQPSSPEFAKYSVSVEPITCKPLDFTSYHKVENLKKAILRDNPNLDHPNFAGKYLLIKNEYLFTTVWFVADCASGKFIKDLLDPSAKKPEVEFKSDSSLLVVKETDPKSTVGTEYHVFQNEKWKRVEGPVSAAPAAVTAPVAVNPPAAPSTTTTISSPTPAPTTDPLFSQYAAPVDTTTCKELDFTTSPKGDMKRALLENTPDRTHANFGGHYLLMKGESIAQYYWLLADCRTGKFVRDWITGEGEFEKGSRLFKSFSSGEFTSYYVWLEEDQQWLKLNGKNTLYGQKAKDLMASLRLEKSGSVNFENLNCSQGQCVADLGKEKAKPLSGESLEKTLKVLSELGIQKIQSGTCREINGKISCDVTL